MTGPMGVPPRLVGVWQRRSISLDGGPPAETADVIWVQTGGPFADLRIDRATGAPVACFAGTTRWEAPSLIWHHEIDLAPVGRADVGAISCRDGDLVETGEMEIDGAVVAYVEVWGRLPLGDGVVVVESERTETGMRVRVGAHQIVVDDRRPTGGAFTATYTRNGVVVLSVDTPALCGEAVAR